MPGNPAKLGNAATRRLNAKEAAAEFNVSVWTIYAMKKAGAPFMGRYCTIPDLDAWWRAHPDFCASRIWRSPRGTTVPQSGPGEPGLN